MKVKGTTLETRFEYVRQMGDEPWTRFVAALSPESAALADEPGLRAGWYPFERFIEISRVIDELFGRGDLEQCRELGRASFSRYSSTIYRVIFRALTIEFLIRRAQVAWRLHYDQGDMSSSKVTRTPEGRRSLQATLQGADAFDPSHCQAVRGWIVAAAEITGSRNVHDRCLQCRGRGDPVCRWQFDWD